MRKIELHGGSYIDALPDGRFAGIRGLVIDTSLGSIAIEGGATPGFLRLNPAAAGIHFGGQGSNFHGLLEWNGHWFRDMALVPTPYGVIYGPDGTRYVWTGGPHLSSQGYRYVRSDGVPVFSDDTLLRDGVSEWTDLSDAQDGSILVGQGHHGGGVVVRIDGVLRLLDDGPCFHINARRQGQQCSIAYVKLGVGGIACWPTLAELRALPEVHVAPPPPIDPPPPPPVDPPEPPPMPNIEALTRGVLVAVESVNQSHPHLLRTNTKESCGEFTERVVNMLASADANFGHVGKQPGQTNYRLHAVDAVMYKSPKQVWDIIGGAENHPHPGQPAANPVEHGDQPWMAPIPVAGEPTPPTPFPPNPQPASDVQAQIDALRHIVIAQETRLAKVEKAIEDAPDLPLPVPQLPGKLRAKGKTSAAGGGWWGKSHTHDIDVEVVPE